MMFYRFVVLALGFLFWGTASANVTYVWHNLTKSPDIWMAKGKIELTDTAWSSGAVNYHLSGDCLYSLDPCNGDPFSPIVNFSFTINAPATNAWGGGFAGITLDPLAGGSSLWPLVDFSADLVFDASGAMSGNVSAVTVEHDSWLSSVGNVWTIDHFGSDSPYFGYDCFSPGCSGATGYWKLMQAEVPEPESLALLGVGLIGIGIARRRRMPYVQEPARLV